MRLLGREDLLVRFSFGIWEVCPERLMTCNYIVQCSFQRNRIHRSFHAKGDGQVIDRTILFEPLQEPQSSLCVRQG